MYMAYYDKEGTASFSSRTEYATGRARHEGWMSRVGIVLEESN